MCVGLRVWGGDEKVRELSRWCVFACVYDSLSLIGGGVQAGRGRMGEAGVEGGTCVWG